jgi:hypothetical protein
MWHGCGRCKAVIKYGLMLTVLHSFVIENSFLYYKNNMLGFSGENKFWRLKKDNWIHTNVNERTLGQSSGMSLAKYREVYKVE